MREMLYICNVKQIKMRKLMNEFCLYIDYDCVEEFSNLQAAESAFNKACKENPDSVIDVLSADGEVSYMGIN